MLESLQRLHGFCDLHMVCRQLPIIYNDTAVDYLVSRLLRGLGGSVYLLRVGLFELTCVFSETAN